MKKDKQQIELASAIMEENAKAFERRNFDDDLDKADEDS